MNSNMHIASPKPAFSRQNVPVAMAADLNYLPYLRVALDALVRSSSTRNLDILLLTSGLDDEILRSFLSGLPSRSNLSVRFLNLDNTLCSAHLAKTDGNRTTSLVPHVSATSCLRLFLPELLPDYEKLIYLDVDVIVHQDLAALYDIELGTDLIAGAVDLGIGAFPAKRPEYRAFADHYGFSDWNHYVNAGVLLLNLGAMRRENLTASLLQLAQEAADFFFDQDALNFVCKGRVRFLSPEWNLMVQPFILSKELRLIFGEPAIYHFAGRRKPWMDPCLPYSYLWWAKVPIDEGIARWRKVFSATETMKLGEGIAASVVVPVYNAAQYLPQMLISLSAQTLENIEIICVDDGSSDDSLSVCKAFAEHDSRIKVVSQSNQGAAAARNNGLAIAAGRWVFFSDADDFCRPEMLAEMVAEGEKGADVVVTSRHYLDCQGRHKGLDLPIPKKYLSLGETVTSDTEGFDVFSGLGFPPWNKLYRRKFILERGLRFYNLPVCEDMTFVVCSLLRAERIRLLPRAYYSYRSGNPTGIVGGMDRYPTVFLEAWREVGREISSRSVRLQEQFYKAAVQSAFWYLTRVKSVAGMQAVYRALCDGGLTALKGEAVDDGALDLGTLRDAYDALMRREPLEVVLLALFSAQKLTFDETRQSARKSRAKVVALEGKVSALAAARDALAENVSALKTALEAAQSARSAEVARLKAKVGSLKKSKAALARQLLDVKRSLSYRLGRWATAPFRRLQKLVRQS